jgi:tetratricopeptide (TPR) repeat protein
VIAQAEDAQFQIAATGSIVTGFKGTVPAAAPPALVPLPSAEAADKISEAIGKAYPQAKPSFHDALGGYKEFDFTKYSYVALFSRPVDNYAIEVKSVSLDRPKNTVTIKFGYKWVESEYFNAPDLQIFFTIIRLPKTDAAVFADYGTETLPALLKPAGIETVLPRQDAPKPSFDVVTEGKISLNEPPADAGEGPFLYVLKSAEDSQKLDARMKETFTRAGTSILDIINKNVKPDFNKNIYLFILSAPCVAADMKFSALDDNKEVGEALLKMTYVRVPQAAGKNADLFYSVVAVPKTQSYFVLGVKTPGGDRRVAARALDAKPREMAQVRGEYDFRLESLNFYFADKLAELGTWCAKNGMYNEARRHFASALIYNPLNAAATRGLRLLEVVAQLAKANPASPAEYTTRAAAYMIVGRFADGMKDIDEALKRNDNFAEAHYVKGSYLLLRHDYAEALKSLDKAISLDPSKARYFAVRARCRAVRGEFDASEKDSATALSLEKDFAPALEAKAVNLIARASVSTKNEEILKLISGARDLCSRAIEADPQDPRPYADRAFALLKLAALGNARDADLDMAFNDCVMSVQLNPYQYEAYLHLATYYIYKAMVERATGNLDRAIEIFPDLPYVYQERGTFYATVARDNNAALKDFDKVVELSPGDAEGYISRARVRAVLHKDAEALADFDKAISLSPGNARYYWERGAFHYTNSNLDNALTDLSKAVELGGGNASTYYMIGNIKVFMEKYDEAIANFNKCLQSKPDAQLKDAAEKALEDAQKRKEAESKKP